tara:strand:+ start:91 stop:201 length:111 start_codon:yes stop_codon:yes gene_type:complete
MRAMIEQIQENKEELTVKTERFATFFFGCKSLKIMI